MTNDPGDLLGHEESTDILGHEDSTDELGDEESTDILGHEDSTDELGDEESTDILRPELRTSVSGLPFRLPCWPATRPCAYRRQPAGCAVRAGHFRALSHVPAGVRTSARACPGHPRPRAGDVPARPAPPG